MKMRMLAALLFALMFLSAPYLLGQDSISTKAYRLNVQPPGSSSTAYDTSGAPPDFVPAEKEPQILKQVIPAYPPLALKERLEGRVILKLWIAANGKPHEAVVLKSDDKIFDQPAIDAAMQYRFTPAILNNKPVAVWVVIPFTFKLKPDSAGASKSVIGGVSIIRQTQGASNVQDSSTAPPDFVPVEKEPRIIKQVVPAYPPVALKDRLEGRVLVKVWVSGSGTPHKAIVLKTDNEVFDRAAVDAAMMYRFSPAISNNGPVAVWVVIPFTFKLKPDSESTEGSRQRIEAAKLNLAAQELSSGAIQLSKMISQYNEGMYHERMKEYLKAMENYEQFLLDAEKARLKTGEMERHARKMIEKYSKMQKDGK